MTATVPFSFDTPGDATRAAELRRVKTEATLVLVATLALFAISKALVGLHPAFGFVAAFAEAAKISRNIQQALYQDAEAFFAGIDKLASAKSISEAVQIQSELARARGEVFINRAKSTTEYFGKLVANGAKNAQDNFAKVYSKSA